MQHSAVITRPAAADTVRRRCLAVLVMSRCLTFRLGDHAEKSPPPRIITVAYQNRQFLLAALNASFHIVSPLCKSKCGNRIRLIL